MEGKEEVYYECINCNQVYHSIVVAGNELALEELYEDHKNFLHGFLVLEDLQDLYEIKPYRRQIKPSQDVEQLDKFAEETY